MFWKDKFWPKNKRRAERSRRRIKRQQDPSLSFKLEHMTVDPVCMKAFDFALLVGSHTQYAVDGQSNGPHTDNSAMPGFVCPSLAHQPLSIQDDFVYCRLPATFHFLGQSRRVAKIFVAAMEQTTKRPSRRWRAVCDRGHGTWYRRPSCSLQSF